MTQLEAARRGLITDEMRRVAERENVTPEFIRDEVARGRLVIPGQRPPSGRQRRATQRAHGAGDLPLETMPAGHPGARGGGALLGEPDRRPSAGRDRRSRPLPRRVGPEAPRPDRHRPHDHHQDQRQHRRLAGQQRHRRRGREAALGAALRRRHADGPLHRRRSGRVPPGDHRPQHHPDRHRADLQHDPRPAHRGSDLRRHPGGGRAPGAAGRRLLHHPRRRAARAPAADRRRASPASCRAAARCWPSG